MSAYSDAINALSPVAYWRLGEASGVVAEDETGNHDGDYINTPTLGEAGLITGDPDTCVDFDAASLEAVEVDDHADLRCDSGPFTILAWFKTTGISAHCIASKIDNVGLWNGWLVQVNSGLINFWTSVEHVSGTLISTTTVNDGAWHLAAATLGSGTGKLYVDAGGAEDSATMPQPGTTEGFKAYLARRIDGWYFDGLLDEVVVLDSELSQDDIANLYEIGTGGELTTSFQCGDCTLTFYYTPTLKRLLRTECTGSMPEGFECEFTADEDGGPTWTDSFSAAGSKDCPYEMTYGSGGEGLEDITISLQVKRV